MACPARSFKLEAVAAIMQECEFGTLISTIFGMLGVHIFKLITPPGNRGGL